MMLRLRRSDKIDLLKQVPLFSDLSRRHLNQIAKHSDDVSVKAGKILAREGTKGYEFFFIAEGEARVEKDEKTINRLSTGDFFGEISLIDKKPRTATVVAETDMILLVVHTKSFYHVLNTIPDLQHRVLLALCKYVRRAEAALKVF